MHAEWYFDFETDLIRSESLVYQRELKIRSLSVHLKFVYGILSSTVSENPGLH